jgi:hypothetical protein
MKVISYSNDPLPNRLTDLADTLVDDLRELDFEFSRYSSPHLRVQIDQLLRRQGWTHRIVISPESRLTIAAMKDKVGLCVQTGNMARYYADLIKLQYLVDTAKIEGGILIVLTRAMATEVGDNVAYFERIQSELRLFECTITLPLLLLGLGSD